VAVVLLIAGLVAAVVVRRLQPDAATLVTADGGRKSVDATTTSSSSTSSTTTVSAPIEPTTVTVPVAPTTAPAVVTTTVRAPRPTVPATAPTLPPSLATPVAAVDGPGLYVVDLDGSHLVRLVTGHAAFPSWSPDGGRLAFTLDDVLTVVGLDGRTKVVSRDAVLSRFGPSWSADGAFIVFPGRGGDASERDVWVGAADGSGARRLARPGDDAAAAVAPDGRIVAMGLSGLWLTADGGGAWRRLGESNYNFGQVRWSPDGTRVAAIPDSMANDGVVDVERGTVTHLGGDEPHRTDAASWCPDGRHLVLEAYFRTQQVFGTWLASADGGAPALLAASDGDPDCRGDDLVVAVQQGGQQGRPWAIVAMRADGTLRRTVVTYGTDGFRWLGHPQVSPDGTRIAFVAFR
jgi:Tol biopolymer transport system component